MTIAPFGSRTITRWPSLITVWPLTTDSWRSPRSPARLLIGCPCWLVGSSAAGPLCFCSGTACVAVSAGNVGAWGGALCSVVGPAWFVCSCCVGWFVCSCSVGWFVCSCCVGWFVCSCCVGRFVGGFCVVLVFCRCLGGWAFWTC